LIPITTNQKNKSVVPKIYFLILMVLVAFNTTSAQMINNGILHISDNSNVYLASGTFTFGTGATTTTTRSVNNYGKLQFQSGVTTTGATNTSLLNGYGTAIGATPFTFPIGQSGVYAPAQVAPSATGTINAAYYRGAPSTIDADLDATVSAISTLEYWNINGTVPAKVKLTWRSDSGLTAIGVANSTANLTIVGYDGIKWVKIASTVDATSLLGGSSTITTGSITSTENIDLNTYQYFALGVENIDCPPFVASSGNTKTWNGSWSPSAPTIADPAIINSAYASGSFACNSLTLNANVTLSNGQSLEVNSGVSGSGKIIMSSEASFVQRLGSAIAPSIELTKKSRQMRRYDYIYWGTPISGNFFSQFAGAIASRATAAYAFDSKIKYVSGAGGGWQPLTAIETGRGFAGRVKNQDPFINGNAVDFINFKFTGTANNGNISVALTRDPVYPNGAKSHVLLANPYPSAIDADKFLIENITIDGVVYIWQSSQSNSGQGESYNQADYLVYTLAGSVTNGPTTNTFNGSIASGQGFLIKSLVDSGNVVFTNCMRKLDNNNQFNKVRNNSKVAAVDRFKLNMTGKNGVFSQILIAYMPEATLGYDRLYDAGRNSVSTAQLYSLFEGDGRKLAINARPPFVDTDVVALGVSKPDTTTETFTITITEKEGIFANGTNVYLFDTDTNEYHNLNEGAFSFDSNSKALNSRFKVVYQNSSLNNPDFDPNTVIASIYKQTLKIKAGLPITNVTIYDITGRLINEIKVNNQLEVSNSFRFAQGIYIAKIKMNNGTVATQKLINKI
jgi:hypothetical protein